MRKTLTLILMLTAVLPLVGCASGPARTAVPEFRAVAAYNLSSHTVTIPRPTCAGVRRPFLAVDFGARRHTPRGFRVRGAPHAWHISHAAGGSAIVYCARH